VQPDPLPCFANQSVAVPDGEVHRLGLRVTVRRLLVLFAFGIRHRCEVLAPREFEVEAKYRRESASKVRVEGGAHHWLEGAQ
jgi:hypothetical protein